MRYLAVGVGLTVVALGALPLAGCAQAREAAAEVPSPVFDVPADGMTVRFVREPVQVDELMFEDIDGQPMSTRDSGGRVTIVNYWATWCGPCREEIPALVRLQERYPDQLRIVGISTDEGDPADVRAFAHEMGVNYPIVMATPELNRQFPGVFALPTSFVVDPDGLIVQTHVGLINPAVLEQEVRHLAALPSDVTVELVDEDQTTRLANAAHATEIPGLDLSELPPGQKEQVLQRLNEDNCSCGCQLTLAQCRINDSACGLSLPLSKQVVVEVVGAD